MRRHAVAAALAAALVTVALHASAGVDAAYHQGACLPSGFSTYGKPVRGHWTCGHHGKNGNTAFSAI